MDIKVSITVKQYIEDEPLEQEGMSSTKGASIDSDFAEIDQVVLHIICALKSIGYSDSIIGQYIDGTGSIIFQEE